MGAGGQPRRPNPPPTVVTEQASFPPAPNRSTPRRSLRASDVPRGNDPHSKRSLASCSRQFLLRPSVAAATPALAPASCVAAIHAAGASRAPRNPARRLRGGRDAAAPPLRVVALVLRILRRPRVHPCPAACSPRRHPCRRSVCSLLYGCALRCLAQPRLNPSGWGLAVLFAGGATRRPPPAVISPRDQRGPPRPCPLWKPPPTTSPLLPIFSAPLLDRYYRQGP